MAEVTLRRHATDVTSLVFGIVFLGIAAVWPLVDFGVLTLPRAGIVLPVVLVIAGLVGLVVSVLRVRRGPGPAELDEDYPGDELL